MITIAVYLFSFFTIIVSLFQLALAAGLPWGAASFGGKYPGKYPPQMRLVALVNILVILFTAVIVLSRAGFAFNGMRGFSEAAIWFVVGFFCLGTIMNSITPSKIERIWAPVAFIQFLCSIVIGLS